MRFATFARRFVFILLLSTTALAGSGCVCSGPAPDDVRGAALAFAHGDNLSELGEYEAAAKSYREAANRSGRICRSDEEHADEWRRAKWIGFFQAATAYAAGGDFKAARLEMRVVGTEAAHPLKALAKLRHGQYLLELGETEEAKDEFRRVIIDAKSDEHKETIPSWIAAEAQAQFDALK